MLTETLVEAIVERVLSKFAPTAGSRGVRQGQRVYRNALEDAARRRRR
jgi:hypothetical protein